jgi:hypothetical protein
MQMYQEIRDEVCGPSLPSQLCDFRPTLALTLTLLPEHPQCTATIDRAASDTLRRHVSIQRSRRKDLTFRLGQVAPLVLIPSKQPVKQSPAGRSSSLNERSDGMPWLRG